MIHVVKQFESEIDHRCVKPYILDTLERFSKKFTDFNIDNEGGYTVHLADVYIFLYVCQLLEAFFNNYFY